MKHKVTITLPFPANLQEAQEIEAKANRMMTRAGDTENNRFSWNDDDRVWEWGGTMGSIALRCGSIDFSLDYLGREFDET